MTTRRMLITLLAATPWLARAQAVPSEVAAEIAGARLQGSGRLTFLMLHVYDARLWVPDGFRADRVDATPVALEIEYARTLYGKLIAERSIEEMLRSPGMGEDQQQRWMAWLQQTLKDVKKGDRLTGVHKPGESLRLLMNGSLLGELRDADFARRFIGIWLSAQTSEPRLRQSLLGEKVN